MKRNVSLKKIYTYNVYEDIVRIDNVCQHNPFALILLEFEAVAIYLQFGKVDALKQRVVFTLIFLTIFIIQEVKFLRI